MTFRKMLCPAVATLAAALAAGPTPGQDAYPTAGQPIRYLDAPEFKPFLDKDAKKMVDVVKAIGKIAEKK